MTEPNRQPLPPSEDDDFAMADIPTLGKLAAAVTAASGVFVGLTGLQLFLGGVYNRIEILDYVPHLQMVLGLAQLVLGAFIYRARMWAILAGLGLGGLNALIGAAWFVYLLVGEAYSCIAFVSVPIAFVAVLLCGIALPGVRRTAAARRRLEERGMGLGL